MHNEIDKMIYRLEAWHDDVEEMNAEDRLTFLERAEELKEMVESFLGKIEDIQHE